MIVIQFERYKKIIPKIPGIQGKDEFFNSSVLVLLTEINNEECFVFQKRTKHIKHGGEICFPGGKIDDSDLNSMETAIRETEEELGIPKSAITIIGQLDTIVSPMGVIIDAFLGFVNEKDFNTSKINKNEVEEVIILPVSNFNKVDRYSVQIEINPKIINNKTGEETLLFPAESLGLPSKYTGSWGGFQYPVYVYHTYKGIIWGLTARLVHEVVS